MKTTCKNHKQRKTPRKLTKDKLMQLNNKPKQSRLPIESQQKKLLSKLNIKGNSTSLMDYSMKMMADPTMLVTVSK